MKSVTADIVVVAAGTAGLAAAVEAAEHGANVIVLEKSALAGGTARMGVGIFAVESRLQKLMQETLTREEAFGIYMNYTHWRVNAPLLKKLIDMSAGTIDWLESMGIKFRFVASHNPGFHNTFHVVYGPNPERNNASVMMKVLESKANELDVSIYFKNPAVKIVKKNERITGVIAKDESGKEVMVKAGAVILATGGFHIGALPGNPGKVGDGMDLAREVGAATSKITRIGAQISTSKDGGISPMISFTFHQPILVVNLLGERFMNEEIIMNTNFGRNAIARQKDNTVINGLYAAGMDVACEIYHGTYPFVLPATAMGFAINSGRLAAENALEYIRCHKS